MNNLKERKMTRDDFRILPHPDNKQCDPSSVWRSNSEPEFCVEHIESGEISMYYPYDQCEAIIRNAIEGKLMGTFGLGVF